MIKRAYGGEDLSNESYIYNLDICYNKNTSK